MEQLFVAIAIAFNLQNISALKGYTYFDLRLFPQGNENKCKLEFPLLNATLTTKIV